MSATPDSRIKITTPSTAFQQIANYVAIAETTSPAESLRELLLHTLFTFEGEKVSSVQDMADILRTIFGVEAPNHQIQEALDQLTSDGQVHQPLGTNYVLTPDAGMRVKTRIDQAAQLQERVRIKWLTNVTEQFPDLNVDHVWDALQDYLAKAFLRHGVQVAIFLDTSVELPMEYVESLSTLLANAVREKIDVPHQKAARHVISGFLASVGNDPERAQLIAECADGAANYFSLAVSPAVANQLRRKLSPFTLFCDTNFLFGILDLHVHPLVDVSNHLLEEIADHNLPINLRFHEVTLQELQASISHYGDILKRHMWTNALSRAAATSRFMSGIELKYHQMNAEIGIGVASFLQPYQHVDVLLEQHNISIYKPSSDRRTERATLEAEYQEYLKDRNKEKLPELISHDVALLDCVRYLRNSTASTAETGALLVTCDYTLYSFDSDASRRAKTHSSVVLPNILWQTLRPFIPASPDFDRSFAETFAIPEFRTIGSGAAKACSRMLGIFAAYKKFPDETATRLLSNDLLIDSLRTTQDDKQFQAQVESAIASENQALLEEQAFLATQVEALRSDKERANKELERQAQESAIAQEEIQAKNKEIENLTASKSKTEEQAQDISAKLVDLEEAKTSVERKAKEESEARQRAERKVGKYAISSAIGLSVILIIVFEIVLYKLPWTWLRDHSNSYALQAGVSFGVVSFMLGLFRPRWRKVCWLIFLFGIIVVIISLLGGPNSAVTPIPKGP
ncbi:MAG: hypothetical protein E3J72_00870 [Planctomycetota bacterium]|nr:MAG: hypothetical protein E3J72_00870 [Planctomycetota bacterium]